MKKIIFLMSFVFTINIFSMDLEDQMQKLCNHICDNKHGKVKEIITKYPHFVNEYHQHDKKCKIFTEQYRMNNPLCCDDQITLLHIAVSVNAKDCVRELLEKNADPNMKTRLKNNKLNVTPLHLAKIPQITHHLLVYEADVDAKTIDGKTPLFVALIDRIEPNFNVAEILIHACANVNQEIDGASLLHYAAGRWSFATDVVKFLVDNKANKKAINKYGKTPLDIAKKMHNGFGELMDLLS